MKLLAIVWVALLAPGGLAGNDGEAWLEIGEKHQTSLTAGARSTNQREFLLRANAGQPLTISAESFDFTPRVDFFRTVDGNRLERLASDIGSGPGSNSRLTVVPNETDVYTIRVGSVSEDWGGEFSVDIEASDRFDTASDLQQDLEYWKQARRRAEKLDRPRSLSRALAGQGLVHARKGRTDRAEKLLHRAINRADSAVGRDHPLYATVTLHRAYLHMNDGKWDRAEALTRQAATTFERTLGSQSAEYLRAVHQLGTVLRFAGDHAAAEPLLIQAADGAAETLGDDHLRTSMYLSGLATLYEHTGEYDLAEQHYRRVLEIRRSARHRHPDLFAFALNNLGGLLSATGDDERAGPLLREAVEVARSTLSRRDPDLAAILSTRASHLRDVGDYEKAKSLYLESMKIRRKAFGKRNPAYVATLHNLAVVHDSAGDDRLAEKKYVAALEAGRKAFGADHPALATVRRNLDALYAETGRETLAEPVDSEAAPRTVDEYLAAVEAIGEPPFDPARKQEPGYMDGYRSAQHELYREEASLLLELCKTYPDHERRPEWMNRRWVLLSWNQDPLDVAGEVLSDVEEVLSVETDPRVIRDGAYWRARFLMERSVGRPLEMLAVAETFLRAYPGDDRGAELLDAISAEPAAGVALRREVFRRLAANYPEIHPGVYAPGMLRRLTALEGREPFELAFEDAITGRPVTSEELRGRVVVVDFWATTCGPCIQQLPDLIELRERHHSDGLAFVGVSLDESVESGGLEALKSTVERMEIPWPQYYQGAGYDSEFSKSWGVGSAPTLFVVDREGLLRGAVQDHTELVRHVEALLAE